MTKEYKGKFVGEGKFLQFILDEETKGKLALENLKRIRKQNKKPS
jgi:hypothetical protein